ncbi:Right handed beta helix region [Loktanella atrilutea]|uniref:Right handed beta helix region n=2 Tax=Loktanella atrilutea TaxID=366533 RepID=A0A1M4URT9_LOKAT|nr:Right handed beta helix region [Loktanella atrilutea]
MTSYYVSTTGSDSGNGTSENPWGSINQAMNSNLQPGDEVIVRPGTYAESVSINHSGTSSDYITLRSEVPGGAVIAAPSGGPNGITIRANYVTVDGFEIYGSDTHGIAGFDSHHVVVSNNISHDNAQSGVSFAWSDFITIEGNETYGNASSGWFSGISLYQNRNITGDMSTDGFRNIIRNNVSHDNVTESGAHTDGNGIIIDDFQSTQTSGFPAYDFPTLVEGNITHGNGGKGIQVTWSDHVTVAGNTAYHNNVDLANTGTWRGEISNAQSSNNTFVNNIAVADPSVNGNNTAIDNNSYGGYVNENVVWQDNLVTDGRPGVLSASNDGGNSVPTAADGNLIGVDPQFVDPARGNFDLSDGSPAIDEGHNGAAISHTDNDGDARIVGQIDMGAQESGAAPVESPDPTPAPAPKPPVDVAPTPDTTPDPTSAPGTDTFRLFDAADRPQTAADHDTHSVELGMRFTADTTSSVSALRLFRGEGNHDNLPATLWDSSGHKIATATFADTGHAGWQEVALDTPVTLAAGETYTVSYHAPNGGYAVTTGYFDTAEDAGPVSTARGAGVYQYGETAALPTQTYQNSNYWIDVVLSDTTAEASPETPSPATPPVTETPPTTGGIHADPFGAAGTVTVEQTEVNGWHRVDFGATLDNASVVMGPLTLNDGAPATVLVDHVTDTGFDFRIAEWNYQDGFHGAEKISWMAVEAGTHTLDSGQVISAGNVTTGRAATVKFDAGDFSAAPVVLTQVASSKGDVVTAEQVRHVSEDGFKVALVAQESLRGQHDAGTVNWIALSQHGDGIHSGTIGGVTHRGSSADLSGQGFADDFVFLADAQTTNGGNTSVIRSTEVASDHVNFFVHEETSQDAEVQHVAETIGFAALDAGLIYHDTVFG